MPSPTAVLLSSTYAVISPLQLKRKAWNWKFIGAECCESGRWHDLWRIPTDDMGLKAYSMRYPLPLRRRCYLFLCIHDTVK